ncbi:MAG: hypothetical protein V1820_02950 [archaeon]
MFEVAQALYEFTVGPIIEGLGAAKQDLDLSQFELGKGNVPQIPARISGRRGAPERPESYQALLDAALKVASGPKGTRVAGKYVNPENPDGLPQGFHIAKVSQVTASVREVPEPGYLWNRPKTPVHYAQVKIARRGELDVAWLDNSASDFFEGMVGTHKFIFEKSELGDPKISTDNAIDRYHGICRTNCTVPIRVGGEEMAAMQLYQESNGKPVYLRLAIAGPLGNPTGKRELLTESLCTFVAATGVLWQAWQESESLKEFERYANAAFSGKRARANC